MFGFSFLLSLLSRGLNSSIRRRSDEVQLRQELLAHQRQLMHAAIPDVHAAQEHFRQQFSELHHLLVLHDPAFLGPKAAASPLYPEITRTLLYQLGKAGTYPQLLELVQREVALWFGRQYAAQSGVEELAIAIQEWRQA